MKKLYWIIVSTVILYPSLYCSESDLYCSESDSDFEIEVVDEVINSGSFFVIVIMQL